MERRRIVVLLDYYLPGQKAGGPVRTMRALFAQLSEQAEFRVITRDRDLGDARPYDGVRRGAWQRIADAEVWYLRPGLRRAREVVRLLRATPHDILYLNTLYSGTFCLVPLMAGKLRLIPAAQVVVAPRGQLSPSAIGIRRWKKLLYLWLTTRTRVFSGVLWQATAPHEVDQIRHWFGANVPIHVAPNLRVSHAAAGASTRTPRPVGAPLRVVFLSRISPMKNLDGALRILAGINAEIDFLIYGPCDDRRYLARCRRLMRSLPPGVRADFRGVVAHDAVDELLRRHDVLLLPTRGENFGHVIVEAMAAGCAPLISDRTPWRGLAEQGVGWDLPLDDEAGFRQVLEACANESPASSEHRSAAAMRWIVAHEANGVAIARHAELLGLR